MPFMDGEETFHRLREIRADIPVVLCTGFMRGDRLDRLMKAGIAGFLRKPLAPDEIVDHIRGVLESLKYARHGGALPDGSSIAGCFERVKATTWARAIERLYENRVSTSVDV